MKRGWVLPFFLVWLAVFVAVLKLEDSISTHHDQIKDIEKANFILCNRVNRLWVAFPGKPVRVPPLRCAHLGKG